MNNAFKFRFVMGGKAEGFLASKASVEPTGLKLGENLLPYTSIVDSTTRDERLVFTIDTRDPQFPSGLLAKMQGVHLVMHVYNSKAESVERAVDRFTSKAEADAHREELTQQGNGHLFLAVECPHCQSTVDLSGLPRTNYTYCRFCESLFGEGLTRLKKTNNYCECDECGYHDRIQGYGEFYFYFLLVVYGFRHSRRHMCDACGAGLANKLLAINSVFLLGVPNAVACAARARTGRDPEMSSLAAANKLAKKGKLAEADQQYESVLRTFKDHPGVRYNQALAYLSAGKQQDGLAHLRATVEACPNYLPGLRLVKRLSP